VAFLSSSQQPDRIYKKTLLKGKKSMQTSGTRSEKLDLRLTPTAKQMIYKAAAATQRSVSDFVIESALVRAEETLADRRHFGLNAEQWEAFMQALAAPPRELPRVKQLFNEKSIFERDTLV
jgi:uncharacterized protein (DUF1778 family)